jgi:lipoate-protein ligase A
MDSGPGDSAKNMACDQALLEAMPRMVRPVLRFYGWSEPAASFGYFQRFADVEKLTTLRPLVRRPTGGGLVPHDADWTYSLCYPTSDPWYALTAVESYKRVHEWICETFEKMGIPARLAPGARNAAVGQCFAGYEQFDVLCYGQKIAGAAQRRSLNGLLIQGSIQPPSAELSRTEWQEAFCEVGRTMQQADWTEFKTDDAFRERTLTLAREKYSQASYNRKR